VTSDSGTFMLVCSFICCQVTTTRNFRRLFRIFSGGCRVYACRFDNQVPNKSLY